MAIPSAIGSGNETQAQGGGEAVPRGISVTHDTMEGDSVVDVTISTPRYAIWLSGSLVGIPALMIVAGYFGENLSSLMLFGLAFGLLALVFFVPDWRSNREIELNRVYMTLTDNMGRGGNSETLKIATVSDITIVPAHLNVGQELLIAYEDDDLRFGSGLSKETLAWLQNYLKRTIMRA